MFSGMTVFESFTAVVTAGVGIATLWLSYENWMKNRIPTKWYPVGELSEILCYPIKSCGPIRLRNVKCTKLGLEDGYLRDRVFMVVDTNGRFVTARQEPQLVLVKTAIRNKIMTLSAPGMMNITIDIEHLYTVRPTKCSVWGQPVNVIDCGEEVAKWFSRFIRQEDFGLRLVFYSKTEPTRDVREKNLIFDTMNSADTGALHDATSFMLFNESSLDNLNDRLHFPAQTLQFRPNFAIKGALPYAEDSWRWVKIGDNVIFRNIKPCTRCILTNVNPETGIPSPDGNPLNMLRSYRVNPRCGPSPVMGIHLGLRIPGEVAVGDRVYYN